MTRPGLVKRDLDPRRRSPAPCGFGGAPDRVVRSPSSCGRRARDCIARLIRGQAIKPRNQRSVPVTSIASGSEGGTLRCLRVACLLSPRPNPTDPRCLRLSRARIPWTCSHMPTSTGGPQAERLTGPEAPRVGGVGNVSATCVGERARRRGPPCGRTPVAQRSRSPSARPRRASSWCGPARRAPREIEVTPGHGPWLLKSSRWRPRRLYC